MYTDLLYQEGLPHFWCAGCGDGIALQAILKVIDREGWTRENTVVTTGIGCWGKADDYVTTNTFHGTHGRALAFATGIRLANPELHVLALMGDGDGITIGGNHLIHAARRNVDITAIMVNNLNYGMTGGQYSGTTPRDSLTKTSVYGHVERPFDVCRVVEAAGGTFVARGTVYDVLQLERLIQGAVEHRGFSFVEIVSMCPTHFGKNNRQGKAPQMLQWIRDHSVSAARAKGMSEEELRDKFVTGVFVDCSDVDDYGSAYQKIIDRVQEGER